MSLGPSGYTYAEDAEGNRLPDFGWVGYEFGCKAIPTVPVVRTLGPVAGDDTASINAALAAVAALPLQADGFRGALLLLPGTYEVSGRVDVKGSGVVLRGSGNGTDPASNTIILSTNTAFDATTDRGEYGIIRMGHGAYDGTPFRASGASVDVTSAFVKVGEDSFTVSDVTPFAVGDWVQISHPITTAWLTAVNGGGTATAPNWTTSQGPIVQARQIRAIDAAAKRLTLKGGLFQSLKRTLSQATVAKVDLSRFAQHSGIEDLRVENVYSSATDEHHAKNAIEVNQLIHGWVRNIKARYFWHAAVLVRSSAQITVRDSEGSQFIGIVTGERGYTFSAEGHTHNILFTKNIARDGRHNYIASSSFSSHGIVFHDSESWNGRGSAYMEAHMLWSTGLLFDNVRHLSTQTGQAIGLYNRGDYGTQHGWACANCVAWNCDVKTADIIVQKPPTAQNYAIGCFGDQITGVKPPAPFSHPTGWVEGANTAGLSPASLYVAQAAAKACPNAGSPTPTPTATRSATRTATRTASATSSRTATATASRSATGTPSRTATATATRSATATASRTATVTTSRSATGTPSGTGTATATRTVSASPTITPTGTLTGTLTASAASSPTVSETATPTPTQSSTESPTPTGSRSGTPSPSPTATPSATPTATAGDSSTMTPPASPTISLSPTATGSETGSATRTPAATASQTVTLTASPTRSASPTASPTGTLTASATSSPTATASASASPTPAPSASVTPTPSLTPAAAVQGPLLILEARPFPNPNAQSLRLHLAGDVEKVRARFYSPAQVLLGELEGGPYPAGWNRLDLPPALRAQLPTGLCYATLEAQLGARRSPPLAPLKLWTLR